MADIAPGKLIYKLFKDQEIHLLVSGLGGETLVFDQTDINNPNYVVGIVKAYHEDCGILELENHEHQRFWISEFYIYMFFEHEFNLIESMDTVIRTGKKLCRMRK